MASLAKPTEMSLKFEKLLLDIEQRDRTSISQFDVDLRDIDLRECDLKKLIAAVSNIKSNFILKLKMNLTDNNSNLELFKPLLAALNKSEYTLQVTFEPSKETSRTKVKELIYFISSSSKLSLDLQGNDIHTWEFQDVGDLLQYCKDTTQLKSIKLWSAWNMRSEAKEWNEKKKQEFLRLFLFSENFSNSADYDALPFSLTSDQYRDFLILAEQILDEGKQWKVGVWISGLKDKISSGDKMTIEAESFLSAWKNQKYISKMPVIPFLRNEKFHERLVHVLNSNNRTEIGQLEISFSEFIENDVPKLNKLLKKMSEKLWAHGLVITDANIEKGQVEKLLLLLKYLEAAPVRQRLDFDHHLTLSELGFDDLCKVTQAICNMPWLKCFNFTKGLADLSDDQLLIWLEIVLSRKNITDIQLSGNGLPKRDISFLQKLYDRISSALPQLHYLELWSDYEVQSIKTSKEWSREYCQLFAKLNMQIILSGDGGHSEKPFSGILDAASTFQLIQEMLQQSKNEGIVHKIRNWVQTYPFTYEQRKFLALKTLELLSDSMSIKLFHLLPEDRLHAFLFSCGKLGHDSLININATYDLLEGETSATDFLKPWESLLVLLEGIEEQYTIIPLEGMAFDVLKNVIQTKLIPALDLASAKHFSDAPFYKEGWHKIVNFRIREGEKHDLEKWLILLQWYTWFMSSLLTFKKEPLNLKNIVVAMVFKEIVDFAEPETRYQAAKILLNDVIANKVGYENYQALVMAAAVNKKKMPEKSSESPKYKTMTLIPALFLNTMLLERTPVHHELKCEKEREASMESAVCGADHKHTTEETTLSAGLETMFSESSKPKEIATDILRLLSSDFAVGNKARAFVGALQALTKTTQLSSLKKLLLVKNLMGSEDRRKKVEDNIKLYFYQLRTKHKNTIFTAKNIKDDLNKILEEYTEVTFARLPEVYQKLFSPVSFDAAIDFTQIDSNALGRSIQSSFMNVYHELDMRRQMANWYLTQGLGLLDELHALADIPPSEYKKSTYTIIKNLFKLEEGHLALYPVIFGGKRNEAALFTYLGKIRTLSDADRVEIETRYRRILHSILTKDSKDFYEQRYNPRTNSHLAKIFTIRPELQTLWSQNVSMDFNEFIEQHDIRWKEHEADYEKYLNNKIFLHRHYAPSECPMLENYLNAKEAKQRLEIKKSLEEMLQAEQDRLARLKCNKPSPHCYKLSLQLELISLVEASLKDKSLKAKYIRNAIRCLNSLERGYEFINDLQSLQRNLESSTKILDLHKTKGWKIVFTDNFWDLFMAGTDVEGSCQRIDGTASLNKCLLSYVQDGKTKMLAIQDETGKTVARCMVRLLLDEISNKPILFMEEMYPYSILSQQKQALEKLASFVADDFNLILVSSEASEESVRYAHPVVSKFGMGYEYVDALHTIVSDGTFSIPSSQVLHSPFAPYSTILQNVLKVSETPGDLSAITNTVMDYLDVEFESRQYRPLHFKWKAASMESLVPASPQSLAAAMSLG